MAIYWCDPYIESPSGGVHGTTGSGTAGSYSNPYSIDNLPESGYSNGDEIRLKALPTNPWITGPAWISGVTDLKTYVNGNYGVYFDSAPAQHSFLKYTTIKGDEQYVNWGTHTTNTLDAFAGVWRTGVPYADLTQPAYQLDPQYYLSNLVTPNKADLLKGPNFMLTTLTAGWVSETTRGGETIIHRVNPTGYTENWFGASAIFGNKMTVDAPELTISHSMNTSSMRMYIYGETVELRDINMRNTFSSSNKMYIKTALTFKANCLTTGGYMYLYSPYYDTAATQGVNRDIKHLLLGYWFKYERQGDSVPINFKFKNLGVYYYEHQNNHNVHLSYYDDFWLNYQTSNGTGVPTEMAVTSSVNVATTPAFQKSVVLLGPKFASDVDSYRDTKSTISTYNQYLVLGAKVDVSKGDVYFRDLNQSSSTTLENTTTHFVTSPNNYNESFRQSKFWGVDRNSGRQVAFCPVMNRDKDMMLMYNSTEYGGKLVYHLMPHEDSGYDRVYLPMPTGVSEITSNSNYRLKVTLGGTTVGSVTVKGYLDGNGTSDDWDLSQFNVFTINASSGGSGTVVYSDSISASEIHGAQQLTLILQLGQIYAGSSDSDYDVAKICIESIELEAV